MAVALPNNFQPQLAMKRDSLAALPELKLPPGYTVRTSREGASDAAAWERIIGESFDWPDRAGKFDSVMRNDAVFEPGRVYFVCRGDEPVATASAWLREGYGRDLGYLHYVGILPSEAGKGLGLQVSLACLHHMAREGKTSAVLQTDDFRLPAIVTYLRLNFRPLLMHENQRRRWLDVFAALQMPGQREAMRDILEGPLFDPLAASK